MTIASLAEGRAESAVAALPTTGRPSSLFGHAAPFFERARTARLIRAGVDADDVTRGFVAVRGPYRDAAQRRRALEIILDGIQQPPAT